MSVYHLPRAPKDASEICLTPTARDINAAIDLAIELRCMGAIIGAPGTGKTTALRAYAKDSKRKVSYCEMNAAQSSTMPGMLAQVCEAMGAPPVHGTYQKHKTICQWKAWGYVEVLLVDEAQHLDDRCLDALRGIHDEARLPLILAGNASLRTRFNSAKVAAFEQLTSRIGPRLELKATTADDMAALAGHYGIADRDAVRWLVQRCIGTGGLRTAARLMELATDIAGKGELRLTHVKQAAGALGGMAQ